jgi:hypothetical protein
MQNARTCGEKEGKKQVDDQTLLLDHPPGPRKRLFPFDRQQTHEEVQQRAFTHVHTSAYLHHNDYLNDPAHFSRLVAVAKTTVDGCAPESDAAVAKTWS